MPTQEESKMWTNVPAVAETDRARATIQTMLGFKVSSNFKLIEKIEKGLDFVHFNRLRKHSGISEEILSNVVGISLRTLSRRKKEKTKFSPEVSDRLVSLTRLFAQTVELFEGDKEATRSWLNSPNHALDGRTPIDIATTENGTREVEYLIGRLEHGVFT